MFLKCWTHDDDWWCRQGRLSKLSTDTEQHHKPVECCCGITKTEWHDFKFIQLLSCAECCLGTVLLSHPPPLANNRLLSQWLKIVVILTASPSCHRFVGEDRLPWGDLVQLTVVYTKSHFTFFFFFGSPLLDGCMTSLCIISFRSSISHSSLSLGGGGADILEMLPYRWGWSRIYVVPTSQHIPWSNKYVSILLQ